MAQYYISGSIRDKEGVPVERTVYAFRRETGVLLDTTISNPSTGAYTLETETQDPVFVVALAGEEEIEAGFNSLIHDRIIPT